MTTSVYSGWCFLLSFLVKFSSGFSRVHSWFQALLRDFGAPWRGLATRTKVAAPACHDQPLDFRLATKAWHSIALVHSVLELEFATMAVGIDVV